MDGVRWGSGIGWGEVGGGSRIGVANAQVSYFVNFLRQPTKTVISGKL